VEARRVTVAIPYHAEREFNGMLARAIASVDAQTMRPSCLILEEDTTRAGSAATRNRALAKVETDWVLWLDSDDQLMPNAVQLLIETQERVGADVVSGAAWIPQIPGHAEPTEAISPGWLSAEMVQERSRLTVTSLVRADLAKSIGGFEFRSDPGTGLNLDDYGFYWKLAEAGATFYRIPEYTFVWNLHGRNTSGSPDRW
jgi:glycosyltransferase involved in cell wall biosynthesis